MNTFPLDFESTTSDADSRPVLPHRPMRDEEEMDITPMIDITFLLLIFFLVASTPDETSKIDLPEARYGKGVSERESIIFSVAEGGIDMAPVFLGDGRIPANQIPGTAKEQADQIEKEVRKALNEERPRQHVLIKAEKGVPHREVARVTAAASRVAGIHLHFAVMEPN